MGYFDRIGSGEARQGEHVASTLANGIWSLAERFVPAGFPLEVREAVAKIGATAILLARERRGRDLARISRGAWPLGLRRRFVCDLLQLRANEGANIPKVLQELTLLDYRFAARRPTAALTRAGLVDIRKAVSTVISSARAFGATASPRAEEKQFSEAMELPPYGDDAIRLRLWVLETFSDAIPRLPPPLRNDVLVIASSVTIAAATPDVEHVERLRVASMPWVDRAWIAEEQFEKAMKARSLSDAAGILAAEWIAIDDRFSRFPLPNLVGELKGARDAPLGGGRGNHGPHRVFAEIVVRCGALEFERRPGETLEQAAERLVKRMKKDRPTS